MPFSGRQRAWLPGLWAALFQEWARYLLSGSQWVTLVERTLGGRLELFRNHKHIWTPGAGRPSARNPRIDALHSVQALACTLKTPVWAHQSCTHEPTRGRTHVVWRGASLQTLRQGTTKPSAALEASRKYAWWPHTHVHENTRLEPDAHPYARRSSHGGRRTPWTVS